MRGEFLDARLEEMKQRFAEGQIPLPPHWGGFRLKPDQMEFWQGRPDRFARSISLHVAIEWFLVDRPARAVISDQRGRRGSCESIDDGSDRRRFCE